MRLRLRSRRLILVLIVLLQACAHAPPSLSPSGAVAWQATRVIKEMDVVRDLAVAGNQISPPLISTATTRAIVTWHRSGLIIARQTPAGWTTTLATSLTEVLRDLPPAERQQLTPYTTLLLQILQETP